MRIFRTTDTRHRQHDGQQVVDLSPLPEESYDRGEVGPMFIASLANGATVQAFADEIREA